MAPYEHKLIIKINKGVIITSSLIRCWASESSDKNYKKKNNIMPGNDASVTDSLRPEDRKSWNEFSKKSIVRHILMNISL